MLRLLFQLHRNPYFELRSYYCRTLWEQDRVSGKPIHQRHAHAHTHNEPGINTELAINLDETLTWDPSISPLDVDATPKQPEGLTIDDVDEMFENFEREQRSMGEAELVSKTTAEINEAYDFTELDRIEQAGSVGSV